MPIAVLHPSAYKNAKKPFPPVPKRDAAGIDASVDRLVADGGVVLPEFTKAFEFFCARCNASADTFDDHDGDSHKTRKASSVGPLKKKDRIVEKALNDYDDLAAPVGAVCDVVRATMAFANAKEMLLAVERLVSLDGETLAGCGNTRFRIAQAKELYSKKLQSRYGDVKLSLLFYVDGVPDGHICEMQLNTLGLIAAKASSAGHVAYEVERTLGVKWKEEHHGTTAPTLAQIEQDIADYDENPTRSNRKYRGKSQGMKDATVHDYYDLFSPLFQVAASAYGPARDSFDQHADAQKLIERLQALSAKVAERWSERFESFGMWPKLE